MIPQVPISTELVHEESRRMLRWAQRKGLIVTDDDNEWLWEPTPDGLAAFLGLLWQRYEDETR